MIENIEKKKVQKAIKDWEKLAKRRVVIGTTVGFIEYEQHEEINKPEEGNVLLRHKSGWTPKEFKQLGYQVRGQGIRAIYGESGLAKKMPMVFLPVLKLLSYLCAPISYFYPEIAQVMICTKVIN